MTIQDTKQIQLETICKVWDILPLSNKAKAYGINHR